MFVLTSNSRHFFLFGHYSNMIEFLIFFFFICGQVSPEKVCTKEKKTMYINMVLAIPCKNWSMDINIDSESM